MLGRKIGDLLDELTAKFLPVNPDYNDDPKVENCNCWKAQCWKKSSLTNSLLGYDRSIVTDVPGTTRDSVNSILKYFGQDIILIDTAGLRKKKRVEESIEFFSMVRTLKSIAECDVARIMPCAAGY